ncbi:hypothetical protein PI125_g20988 [Phytophthora idaei]|nr:hypothetical protein PI125_g20988 [Phytophthora idaei]KAG3133115.1 hypothetical protein PI126_g19313 [Phytophthora idaei]
MGLVQETSVGAQANTACSGTNAQSVPPPDAIVVDITGTNNASYQTVAKGMLHLPNTTEQQTIFVFPGVYQEHVVIPRQAGLLVVQGYTCDMTSYTENKPLRLKSSSGVKFYNVNVANPTGKINTLGQAVAVYVDAPNYGFYSCNFTGYQDTLCALKGRELYTRSYISGVVNFIFITQAKAWSESCAFETAEEGGITANDNRNSSNLPWTRLWKWWKEIDISWSPVAFLRSRRLAEQRAQ